MKKVVVFDKEKSDEEKLVVTPEMIKVYKSQLATQKSENRIIREAQKKFLQEERAKKSADKIDKERKLKEIAEQNKIIKRAAKIELKIKLKPRPKKLKKSGKRRNITVEEYYARESKNKGYTKDSSKIVINKWTGPTYEDY